MAKHKVINVEGAAPFPLPLSHGTTYGNLVFLSGQVSNDLKNGQIVPGDITEQTRRALSNMKLLLENAGSSLDCVLKALVFLVNKEDFPKMNAVYAEFFKGEIKPARSTIITQLNNDALLVEIEAVAYIPD